MPDLRVAMVATVCGLLLTAACQGGGQVDGAGRDESGASGRAAMPSAPATVPATSPKVELPVLEDPPRQAVRLAGTVREAVSAPAALLHAAGSLWVQDHRGTVLTRVDPATGGLLGQVDVGRLGCGDLVSTDGAVWWTGCGVTPGLVRVDTDTSTVSGEYPWTGLGPAVVGDELWLPTDPAPGARSASLNRVTLDGAVAVASVEVPGLTNGDAGAVFVAGSVWVADGASAIVYQVDPRSGAVLAAVPMPMTAGTPYLLAHDHAPFYYDAARGALVRIDPRTLEVDHLAVGVERPSQYWGVAASEAPGEQGRLWVRSGDGEVWLVDTRADAVLRRIAVDSRGAGGDVQQIGDDLWVSGLATGTVERIDLTGTRE